MTGTIREVANEPAKSISSAADTWVYGNPSSRRPFWTSVRLDKATGRKISHDLDRCTVAFI